MIFEFKTKQLIMDHYLLWVEKRYFYMHLNENLGHFIISNHLTFILQNKIIKIWFISCQFLISFG